jgi:hypothetical protein
MKFDTSTSSLKILLDEYERDIDVIRAGIVKDL